MQTDLNVQEGFTILRRVARSAGVFAMVFLSSSRPAKFQSHVPCDTESRRCQWAGDR